MMEDIVQLMRQPARSAFDFPAARVHGAIRQREDSSDGVIF